MSRVRVAIIDPHDLVVAGVVALLARCPDRVELVEWTDGAGVDVVLYGVDDETATGHDEQLHALLRRSPATIIGFGWKQESPQALLAAACGVHGFAHKQLPADQLVARIELLHRARCNGREPVLPDDGTCHPGVESAGLTAREIDVLSLIASGQTNREIADGLFLSINSVKTYVRSAYRKVGVTRRSQAVIWARQHGLGVSLVDDAEVIAPVDAQGA